MFIDAKLLTVLVFIIINFLIIFAVRTRTTIVISLIIAHLVAVLFFSLSISNYNSFKEIVLALIIYSMVILFLISNYNPIYLADKKFTGKKFINNKTSLAIPLAIVATTIIFTALIFIAKNITPLAQAINTEKSIKKQQVVINPTISKIHPAHIAVKERYLEKISKDKLLSNKTQINPQIKQIKIARLKQKLEENFLLKRSSDVILIIFATMTILLVFRVKVKEEI